LAPVPLGGRAGCEGPVLGGAACGERRPGPARRRGRPAGEHAHGLPGPPAGADRLGAHRAPPGRLIRRGAGGRAAPWRWCMATIDSITLEVTEVAAAERFYAAAFDVGDLLRLRASDSPTSGFRGFTLSLVVPQPSGVDALVARARDAGAIVLQEPTKSL